MSLQARKSVTDSFNLIQNLQMNKENLDNNIEVYLLDYTSSFIFIFFYFSISSLEMLNGLLALRINHTPRGHLILTQAGAKSNYHILWHCHDNRKKILIYSIFTFVQRELTRSIIYYLFYMHSLSLLKYVYR